MSTNLTRPLTSVALISIVAAAGGACSRMEDKQMIVGGVTYHFPSEHVEAFTESGKGTPFVRLRPPGANFDLIYSARAKYRRNFQSRKTPLVTTVNDHSAPHFEQFNTPKGVTVCRSDHPHYGCGLRIEDEGLGWSVVFSKEQVPNSDAIRNAAEKVLKTYRS